MDVQQYERDIARIEAHKLDLKEDGFRRLTEQVRSEIRARARYLRDERGVAIILHDNDWLRITVENADGLRLATFMFTPVRYEVDVQGDGVHYIFEVVIERGKATVTGRKFGQLLGPVSTDIVIDAVRNAVDSITDLPRPIT